MFTLSLPITANSAQLSFACQERWLEFRRIHGERKVVFGARLLGFWSWV
jgi:hypothetical protein